MRDQLSLCMIVRNEERELARCLDSVRGLAGEFIVVDTGSTDATRQIAARYGAEVLAFDFTTPDFAAARNHAISHATGRWILMLDADEILDSGSAQKVEALVELDANAGYYFERRNHSSDVGNFTTDYVVRLFPNRPDYRFRGRVHETADASILSAGGQLHKTDIGIDHNFCSPARDRRSRNHWYIEILKEEIATDPTDLSRLDFLAAEFHQLKMFDEAAEIAERLACLKPLDHRAQLFAGIYHLRHKSDPIRAREYFKRALTLRPDFAEAEAFLKSTMPGA